MRSFIRVMIISWLLVFAGSGVVTLAADKPAAPPQKQPAPPPGFDPARHMRIDEVSPGMKGYGVTVFHGATPEPFPVEVVSVEQGFSPDKAVVWIRCPDPRMQLTGPVQGMSGSPIYLWTDKDGPADQRKIGAGGRIIGAFAFGHRLGKDCYVGVQPIENMLRAGNRAKLPDAQKPIEAGAAALDQNLAATWQIARQNNLDAQQTWRLAAISKLVGYTPPAENTPLPTAPPKGAKRMMLPVSVGSPQQAQLLAPYFAPVGLSAMAGNADASAGLAPKWIDPDKVKMAPGSVFAIPLAYGPIDMAAIGTCTDVLPDGTALAFGHRMFAEGDTDVPMATGFVHFIQPNLDASFKLGGSLKITGAVVRDEAVAVVGKPGVNFPSAPARVHVRWVDSPELNTDFEYTIVHHNRLLPALIAASAAASIDTDTTLPRINTVHLNSQVKFVGGKSLDIRSIAPNANASRIPAAMVPPIATLIENEFGTMQVESVDTTLEIRSDLEIAQIVGATLQQSVVKPGDTLVVHVRLQPFRDPEKIQRVELKIPDNTPDGQYNLMIGGAQPYAQLLMTMKPHMSRVANQKQLFKAMQELLDIRDDALYTVLRLNEPNNLAIGRSELPNLPSSRVALLAVPTSTTTTQYANSLEHIDAQPYVVVNQVMLPVKIQQDPGDQQP
ncbi:hypothetical protein HED60_20145 [Planctomycetales bacterium ZRK34]|nr:hypothetical protein HED60_20145 [Planctomycetales bacterium ZRK34]